MALTDAPPPPERPSGSVLGKIIPFTSIGVLVAALYVAWTFYARHQSELDAQKAAETRQEEQRQRTVREVFGNGEIKFTMFSADTGLLKRGDHTQLCYGVENAKTVRLDPPVQPLEPTYRRCIEISPKTTTTYTITADDGKGHTQSHSLTVHVQ